MKLIYGYSNCSNRLYTKIVSEKNASVLRPDQKYHSLLINGLSKHVKDIECISGLPVNRTVTDRKLIYAEDEREGNVHYHYITTFNRPGLRRLMIFCGTFLRTFRTKKDTETFAICDCLNIANALGMELACRLKKIPIVLIVTDLPDFTYNNLLRKFGNALFNKSDGFIILTKQMNEKINKDRRPYIVLEGHVDSDVPVLLSDERYEQSNGKRIIIYAGSILKLYGIQNLVEGFIKADLADSELWIYGDGDFKEELEKVCKEHTSVIYKGLRDNKEIVAEEMKASLLVNPRPSAPEYTKYSFPSKNMEYMVSGTPVLTTHLPGMPDEYLPYVYIIEDETADGIAESLKKVFQSSYTERSKLGKEAKEFVLSHKSNVAQAGKIVDFLRERFR